MLADPDLYIQVAGVAGRAALAFASEADLVTIINPCRYLNLQGLGLLHGAVALAITAR